MYESTRRSARSRIELFLANVQTVRAIQDLQDRPVVWNELPAGKYTSPQLSSRGHRIAERFLFGVKAELLRDMNRLANTPQGRRAFFESFRSDEAILGAHIFVCNMPSHVCQLFLPFNRTLVMLLPFRWYLGFEPTVQKSWRDSFKAIAENSKLNFVAGMTRNEQAHLNAWFGVSVPVVPPYCRFFQGSRYSPSRSDFLVFGEIQESGRPHPSGSVYAAFIVQLRQLALERRLRLTLRAKMDVQSLLGLGSDFMHPGVIYFPYTYGP